MSNIINCYVDMWKNFANFSGRTDVGGYWWAVLGNFIVSFVLGLIGVEVLISVYSLATLIPTLSIAVRRLRDAGKGWGWLFINLVPLVGWIIFIIMLCKPSVNDNIVDAL
jgi:uncharacterized membrane protein YhaH (DUF805 family)